MGESLKSEAKKGKDRQYLTFASYIIKVHNLWPEVHAYLLHQQYSLIMQRMCTYIMPLRKKWFIALLLLTSFSSSFGRTYYSRQSGLWSVPSTWSTVTYGNITNAGTYPQRGDVVYIGDGHDITMNVNAVTASITVGQGTSGSLMYSNYLTFLMVIAGDLTVNAGATFGYAANSSRMHNCYISGNFVNNGTVDVYYDANDYVNITFNSRVNSVVSGTGSWDLNTVTLYKSTLTSYRLEVTASAFETAVRNLVVTYGTYAHNNAGTYNVNPSGGNLTVGPDAIFEAMAGILHLSPNNDYVYLQGQLNVSGGTMRIGASTGLQGLRYDQNGATIPGVTVSSGSLNVYGGITYRIGHSADPFRFSQSGGTTLLNTGSNGCSAEVFQISNNASSRFTMSSGSITLQKPNTTGVTVADFDFCGTTGVVTCTGGTLYFGNSSTSNGAVFTFQPYSVNPMPDTRISGLVARAITLAPVANATGDCSFKSMYIEFNKTLDMRAASGTTGDTRNMDLTGTYDGIRAFYNAGTFTPRSGTVSLIGTAGQRIDGSVTTTFYNLTVNNSSGVRLNRTVNVSNTLMMTNGVMTSTSTNTIVCLAGAAANIGSSVSYVDGPMQQLVASTSAQTINFPVGKNGVYRPIILAVQHSTSASVTYTSEVYNISARAMSYALPPTIDWVSDIRYYTITRTSVANLSNARVTLSYGADDYVTDPANLRVARDNGSAAWLDLGGTGTAAGTGSITSSNFSGFNTYFTLANNPGGSNPLPVKFVNFDGKSAENTALLNWSTSSEENSDYFEIQRSTDGAAFEPIGVVKAAGFSTELVQYEFTDHQPVHGTNYYRLRQVDMDGHQEMTHVVAITFNKTSMQVFPNPIQAGFVSVQLPDNDMAYVASLFDLSGKEVASLQSNGAEGARSVFTIGQDVLPGSYLLRVMDVSGRAWIQKVVVAF